MAAENVFTPGNIKEIYMNYIMEMNERRAAENFTTKLGSLLAGSNKNDALQDGFAKNVEEAVGAMIANDPDPAVLYEVLHYMFTIPQDYAGDAAVYFMLLAVQRYAAPAIPLLSAQDAASLLEVYEKAVPKRDRVPVVKDIMKQLKKQAK